MKINEMKVQVLFYNWTIYYNITFYPFYCIF